MSKFGVAIQTVIVEDLNNFGDWSVCGNDLDLAADLAITTFHKLDPEQQAEWLKEADAVQKIVEERVRAEKGAPEHEDS